jgi:hypothetical protein
VEVLPAKHSLNIKQTFPAPGYNGYTTITRSPVCCKHGAHHIKVKLILKAGDTKRHIPPLTFL